MVAVGDVAPGGAVAPYVFADEVDAFAAFCGQLRTDDARNDYPPFVLEDWQRRIARSVLVDGVVETLVMIPKGNGKTTLLAALALWHVLTTGTARCYIGAASRQQAGEMFEHAKGFVDRDMIYERGELVALLEVQKGYKRITRRDDGGFLEVRAADANTQDGVGPTLALVDEYHRHPTDALYSVFRDGLDKRDGQLVTISTAGDDEETPLGRLRAGLLEHVEFQQGRYTYCYDELGSCVLHEWALLETDDPNDLEIVKLANPLSTITVEKLRRRRNSKSMTLGTWARLTCNLWGTGDEAALARIEWAKLDDPHAAIPEGAHIYLGMDLAWKWDTFAMVPVWWDEESQRYIIGEVTILTPPRDGTNMGDELPLAAVKWYAERYRVTVIGDPNVGGQEFLPRIERELAAKGDGNGIVEVAEHPQSDGPMADAAMRTVAAVRTGALAYNGDVGRVNRGGRIVQTDAVGFTKQVLAATAEPIKGDDEERFRFGKPRGRRTARRRRGEPREFRCIDAIIALAMVIRTAETEEENDYEPWVA